VRDLLRPSRSLRCVRLFVNQSDRASPTHFVAQSSKQVESKYAGRKERRCRRGKRFAWVEVSSKWASRGSEGRTLRGWPMRMRRLRRRSCCLISLMYISKHGNEVSCHGMRRKRYGVVERTCLRSIPALTYRRQQENQVATGLLVGPCLASSGAVRGAGAKVLAGRGCFGTDPLFLGRHAKSKINPMWDCLVLITSILSLIYLVMLQLRIAKWNRTETTRV